MAPVVAGDVALHHLDVVDSKYPDSSTGQLTTPPGPIEKCHLAIRAQHSDRDTRESHTGTDIQNRIFIRNERCEQR